jgi:hypothetical protein
MEETRNACEVSVENLEWQKPHIRPRFERKILLKADVT